ncbi:LuxR C-terminal-related transcriptional regulator [Bradyrhizobium australiense]|uniref:Response regulator transcription factor n=1 Tax=Bradyrhizobium australiense TaxID=2721161 RepID=A0A7Y4LUM0_9BRAD|nr:response regulator transcription factor [Bradyrhizobium australiense]NOJ39149.1 response regulator transcription factor [Bradyrhizobium australiense]
MDDHLMYRKALRSALESHIAKTHVLEADNLETAWKRLDPDGCIDLSLIDLSTAGVSFETLRGLHECYPKTRFAAMMASATRADIMRSLDAGLYGFVSKSQSDSEILGAIKDMLSGRVYVPASLTKVGERPMNGAGAQIYHSNLPFDRAEALPDKLTPRQREVLALLARGMSNKEIARALRIAEGTTKIHASGVLRVLGVRNRTEAAAIAKVLSVTADGLFRRR